MKRTLVALVVVALPLLAILYTQTADSQPIPPAGLREVTHDNSLRGSGTVAAPLGIRDCAPGLVPISNGSGSGYSCGVPGITNIASVGDLTQTVDLAGDLEAYDGSACSSGYVTAVGPDGSLTCSTPSGLISGLTSPDLVVATSATTVGNFAGKACVSGWATATAADGSLTCSTPTPQQVAQTTLAATAAMSGTDWVPSGTGTWGPTTGLVYITGTSTTLSGVSSTASGIYDGQRIIFVNESGVGFNVVNMAAGELTAANKIATQDALTPEQVSNQGFFELQYSAAAGHWNMINFNSGFPTFNTITATTINTNTLTATTNILATGFVEAGGQKTILGIYDLFFGNNTNSTIYGQVSDVNQGSAAFRGLCVNDGFGSGSGRTIACMDPFTHGLGWGSAGSAAMPELIDFASTNPSGTSCSAYHTNSIAVGGGVEVQCVGGFWEPFATEADVTVTTGDIAIGGATSGTLDDYAGSVCSQTPLPQAPTSIDATGALSCSPFAAIDSTATWELAQWDATSGHLTWWTGSACPAGKGVTAMSGSGVPTCSWLVTNTASVGDVPTTVDGSGDLGPSGFRSSGSGSTGSNSVDNTPSNINGADSTHLEWSEEYMTSPWESLTATGGVPATAPFTLIGQGIFRLHASSGAVVNFAPKDGVGLPGVDEMSIDATKGAAQGYIETSDGTSGTQNIRVTTGSTWEMRQIVGFPSIGTSTQSTSFFWWVGIQTGGWGGCAFYYDPSNMTGLQASSGQFFFVSCGTGSLNTTYILNGSGTCDNSFAKGTAAVASLTLPTTNLYDLDLVMTSTEADFYVNRVKVCQITTHLPATTTGLYANISGGTSVTSSATIKFDYDYTKLAATLSSLRP